jgi:hypothetical protein
MVSSADLHKPVAIAIVQFMVAIISAPRAAKNLPAFREKLWSYAMNRLLSAALALLAVATWSSEGWSRTTRQACDVHRWVNEGLDNWKKQLAKSTPKDPSPIVSTYDPRHAVLLPTCANGPLTNQSKPETITDYFKSFLKDTPVVAFDKPIVGGVCGDAFASGLYSFKLNGGSGPTLRARYTFVFHGPRALIMQHHSSLEPRTPDQQCAVHKD